MNFKVQVRYTTYRNANNSQSKLEVVNVEARDNYHATKVASAMFENSMTTVHSASVIG